MVAVGPVRVITLSRDHDARCSIAVSQNKGVVRAVEAMAEEAWVGIDYTVGGVAHVAECPYGDQHRLVVRRTNLIGKQAELLSLLALPRLHH